MTRDNDRLRHQILRENVKSRRAVGLQDSSSLSLLQLAALYKPELAHNLAAEGHDCDLHSSCALGYVDRIEELASDKAFSQCQEHMTPMGWAILKGQVDSVAALLSRGDNPNRPLQRIGFFEWEIEALGSVSWSPIHAASTHGYHETASKLVQLLVGAGANVEELSPLGYTPLVMACIYSWTDVISTLLKLGADVDARSEVESDLVWRLSAPANAERASRQTPLMIATGEGQKKSVELLLTHGCDTSIVDSSGMTALHIAANPWWKENLSVVKLLLDAGMDPQFTNASGETPAERAKRAGLKETFTLLSDSN